MTRIAEQMVTCEDALTYLPRKPLIEFAKGRVIYGGHQPCESLYVVILGRVKVNNTGDDGCQIISRIVCAEGLFGEPALIGASARSGSGRGSRQREPDVLEPGRDRASDRS